ncbi:TRAP transporter large permease [Alteribacillus sp. YIM 98480]|uniref:TRAP transporter large permease n=1 Tax=Alteribacillus sp. YIM 98480 TaxID=2606599 RepID=UPI00131A694C|nr:TRAP transporter large permease [Alteribacillus sp. YIM 98480]
MIALTFSVLLIILLFAGLPIGFTLIFIGATGIFYMGGIDMLTGVLPGTIYSSVNSFTYTTVPLFILMAHFLSKSNIAVDLFQSVLKWIGHLPGGAGVATVFSSAGFGALSGSSIAATSIMSEIAAPQMMKANYTDRFTTGLIASSTGTLAALIPPSIPLIIYGIQTETSVAQLLVAGIVPGILLSLLLCLVVIVGAQLNNSKVEKSTWSDRLNSIKPIFPIIILIFSVIVFLYAGFGTSTEAAAFGAFAAMVLGFLLRRLNIHLVYLSLKDTVRQTAMIFTIVIGAEIFAFFISLTRIGDYLISFITESGFSPYTILLLIIVMYLILGMFLDMLGSMLITLPLVFPLIIQIGFDPLWFGVVLVILLEIGLVTPPVGMNLYVTSKHAKVPVERVFQGSVPFILVLLLLISLFVIFPELILYLPSQM